MSTASIYSVPREARNILKRFRKAAPSLTIELYPNHFRFQHQSGIFLYDSPMSAFLDAVKAQQIPAQFLSTLSTVRPNGSPIAFYDGCLIVELVDFRASVALLEVNGGGGGGSQQPTPVRVILQPTPESSWVDLQMLSDEIGRGRWDDGDLLEVEARILASTAPPLHTGTSLYALRVANEACSSSSVLATSARPSSTSSRMRNARSTYADGGDPSSAFSLLRTGAPSSSSASAAASHTANFRATFARLQNIESFRQRVLTDASLTDPNPFSSRLAPPPSRSGGGTSFDKASAGGGAGSNVYESRPNSPTGKAGGKRRASNAAPGDEEDGAPKKKASGGKKKKKKVPAEGDSTATIKDAATPASPGKDAATPAASAPAKKKASGGKKKKKETDTATTEGGGESTAAPTPAASELDETKPASTAKKAPAKAKKKVAPPSASPVAVSAGTTAFPPMVSHKTLPSSVKAPAISSTPSTLPSPQSFASHVQKTQAPFSLALPTNAGMQQQQQLGLGLPAPTGVNGLPIQAMPGQIPSQAAQLAHLQAQLLRQQAGYQQANQWGAG